MRHKVSKIERLSPTQHIRILRTLLLMALGVIVFLGERVYDDMFTSYPLPSSYQLCFTPNPSCLNLIRKQIDAATHTVLIQAYSFTDPDIAESLVSAKKRGVDVRIILDKSNLKDEHSKRPLMINAQIPIIIDKATGIAHNKVMIIDGRTVITGSYNFSKSAYTRNAENVLVLHSEDMANFYTDNFQKRWMSASK